MSAFDPDERLRVGGDELRLRLTGAQSGGEAIAFEVEIPSGGGPPMLHRHRSLELYRVEDGELAFYLEDANGEVARRAMGAGGVAFIPGGAEHTVRNESRPLPELSSCSLQATSWRRSRGASPSSASRPPTM